jgi:hypothetical protein
VRNVRSLATLAALAITATATALPAASARSVPAPRAAMKAGYAGTVRKVNMGNHSFTLSYRAGKVVRIHTSDMTHYRGVKNFMAITKGAHVAVKATLRASDHTWWATSISSM